ncbi:MAG: glutaminase, partial [Bacteroidales bacterium]
MEVFMELDGNLVSEVVNEAYDRFLDNGDGKNADYIPYLANVDSDLFAISVCTCDGTLIEVGSSSYEFGIESVSKVPTALLAMEQYGADEVLRMIGADATGLPFNSIMALLLEKEHPSSPLVNAGAISACSMVKPVGDTDGKWEAIMEHLTGLCGSAPKLIDELYKSESDTNYNNRAIAWLLKGYERIYDEPL